MSAWRYTLYGQCIIFLMAFVCHAQYNANSWPAYQNPRDGYNQVSNIFASVKEHCYAVGYTQPSAPAWYRSQRGNVASLKTTTKAIVPYFCDTRFVTNSSLESWLNGQTSSPISGLAYDIPDPSYTMASFFEVCKLPTNFFDYTPYRGLDGIGPFTNDSSVGHAHGWTNEYTVAGGTNFPTGRSAWYTTDYGVDSFRIALTNMRYTFKEGVLPVGSGYQSSGTDTNEASAKSIAESEWSLGNFPQTDYQYLYTRVYYDGVNYLATMNTVFSDGLLGFSSSPRCTTNMSPSSSERWFLTACYEPSRDTNNANIFPADYYDFGLGYDKVGSWYDSISSNTLEAAYGWQLNSETSTTNSGSYISWYVPVGTNMLLDWAVASPASGATITHGFKTTRRAVIFLDFAGNSGGFSYK